MKKCIVLFLALLLFSPAFAQVLSPDTIKPVELDKGKKRLFHGMIIVGANFSQMDGDRQTGFNKAGANAGVGLLIDLPKKFSVSMEILYSMKGANGSTDDYRINYFTHSIHLDYIDLALMANYYLLPYLMFSAGLVPNVLVRQSDWFPIPCAACTFGVNDPTTGYRPVTLDGSLGITGILKHHWGLNFRWQYSIIRVNDIPYNPGNGTFTTLNGQLWNSIVALRALYIF